MDGLCTRDVRIGLRTVSYTAYSLVLMPVIQYESKPNPYRKPKSQTVDGTARP